MGEKLYRKAKNPKFKYWIESAGHNDTYFKGGKEYFDKIEYFVRNGEI